MIKQVIKKFSPKVCLSETHLWTRLNQRGMSLAEVIAASAVTTVIAIGSASLVAQSRSIANFGEFQANLDARHSLNVQKVKNIGMLLDSVGLLGIANTSSAHDCFKRKGTNCDATFGVPNTARTISSIFRGDPGNPDDDDIVSGTSTDGLVAMSVLFTVECSSTRCSKLIVDVSTQPSAAATARGLHGKVRFSRITIPTSILTDKKSIDFSCSKPPAEGGSGEILTKVEFDDLKGTCDNYVADSVTCSGGRPPIGYGGTNPTCYSPISTGDCTGGVKATGPFSSTHICNL